MAARLLIRDKQRTRRISRIEPSARSDDSPRPNVCEQGSAFVIAILVRRWTRRAPGEAKSDPLDPQLEHLVDEELARVDP